MKTTGPTNPVLLELIQSLKEASLQQKAKLWNRVASDLERPTRNRRAVNLSRINKHAKENEIVVVPGKVLGSGVLEHKVTISAYQFSSGALDKINKVGAKAIPLAELLKSEPKGKKIKIIG